MTTTGQCGFLLRQASLLAERDSPARYKEETIKISTIMKQSINILRGRPWLMLLWLVLFTWLVPQEMAARERYPEMTSLYRSDFFEIQRSLTGKEADQNVVNLTLCYYCSQLKQTFSRTVQMRYEMGKVYGLEENIVPHFTIGTTKYPVVMTLNVSAFIDKADIQPAQGDYFAAFIGEECRGVSSADNLSIIVYGRQEGESITLKYYQTATGKVFDFSDVAKTKR